MPANHAPRSTSGNVPTRPEVSVGQISKVLDANDIGFAGTANARIRLPDFSRTSPKADLVAGRRRDADLLGEPAPGGVLGAGS